MSIKWDILFLDKAIGAQILLELRQNDFFHVHVPFDIITGKSELPDIWYYRAKRNIKLLSFFIIEGLIISGNRKAVLKTKETGRFGINMLYLFVFSFHLLPYMMYPL
jgi:hypothetical protein